jgi:hypothetical protein
VSKIIEKHQYLNKDFIFYKSGKIFEYDIKDAGFSILQQYDILSDKEVEYLKRLSKSQKNIFIGKLSTARPEIFPIILEELVKVRQQFYKDNKLTDADILSIKKDAIFTLKQCNKLEYPPLSFSKRHIYSTFLFIDGKEFYYNYTTNVLDVKNISNLHLHTPMIGFIKNLLRIQEETESKRKVFEYLKKFRADYLSGSLDIGYYREFNSQGSFLLDNNVLLQQNFLSAADNSLKPLISNRYNYINVLLPIISIMV